MQSYTISKLATILSVPETTLRNWRDRYPEFISSVGLGRTRKYPNEILAVFEAIKRLSRDGKTTDEIRHYLQNEFPIHPEPVLPASVSQITSQPASYTLQHTTYTQHPYSMEASETQQQIWRELFRQTLSEAFFHFKQEQSAQLESLADQIQHLQEQAASQEHHFKRLQDSIDQITIHKSRKETHGRKDPLKGILRRLDQFLIKNKSNKQPEEQLH